MAVNDFNQYVLIFFIENPKLHEDLGLGFLYEFGVVCCFGKVNISFSETCGSIKQCSKPRIASPLKNMGLGLRV